MRFEEEVLLRSEPRRLLGVDIIAVSDSARYGDDDTFSAEL